MSQAMASELLEFPAPHHDAPPTMGIALNLEEDAVGAIILRNWVEHLCG